MTPEILGKVLGEGAPLLTGANGTDLNPGVRGTETGPDDIRSDSFGHFLVICG